MSISRQFEEKLDGIAKRFEEVVSGIERAKTLQDSWDQGSAALRSAADQLASLSAAAKTATKDLGSAAATLEKARETFEAAVAARLGEAIAALGRQVSHREQEFRRVVAAWFDAAAEQRAATRTETLDSIRGSDSQVQQLLESAQKDREEANFATQALLRSLRTGVWVSVGLLVLLLVLRFIP